eukprot:15466818-Alexandrium_andersonii.AAC.1
METSPAAALPEQPEQQVGLPESGNPPDAKRARLARPDGDGSAPGVVAVLAGAGCCNTSSD